MRKLLSFILIAISLALPVLAILSIRHHVIEQHIDWKALGENAIQFWPLVLLVILLMPINWSLEISKWRSLRNSSFRIAMNEVLSGLGLAFFTPNRIGEAGGRLIGIPAHDRWQAGASFFYSSLAQSLCTLWAGILGITLFNPFSWLAISNNTLLVIFLFTLVLGTVLYFHFQNIVRFIPFGIKWKTKLNQIQNISKIILLKVLLLSISRYTIFSVQYMILILWIDPQASMPEVLAGISITYLICALVPGTALAELGIRESVGVLVIGLFANPVAVVTATFLLWVINLAGPSIIGSRLLGRSIIALKSKTA